MSPSQEDYGSEESPTLVPGALTAFRHFFLHVKTGDITPMNYDMRRAANGFPQGVCGEAYQAPVGFDPEDDEGQTYEAKCTRRLPWNDPKDRHEAPNKECTCGFYASYDPDTDFYPGRKWGDQYAIAQRKPHLEGWVIVRAVVELSGRIVMGRVGVRAERMKIKALAIDFSKKEKQTSGGTWTRWATWLEDGGAIVGNGDEYPYTIAELDDDAYTIACTASAAARYGAKFYDSVDEMHRDHPKEDVEALGVDTTPKPEEEAAILVSLGDGRLQLMQPKQYGKWVKMQAQAELYANALKGTIEQIDAATKAIRAIFDEAFNRPKVSLIKEPKPSPFEKALAAKKARPAPPGAGIDYRRRKL